MTMADPALRQAIEAGEYVVAPGVYDLISALVADRMGFKALYVTGFGTVASHLGLPDAGLATYRDMLERVAQIVKRTKTPVIADADTGYGGLLNVRHTVQGYEEAGVSAIQIEDQEFPKKCGHTPGRRVIALDDMVAKVRVACDSRASRDFLIIARTDARTALGLEEALRRAEAYAAAGADIIFVEAPESEAEMAEIGRRVAKPLLANIVDGGRTPRLPGSRLKELGFALSIMPTAGFLAASAALQRAYGEVLETGNSAERTELFDFAEFCRLVGFEDVWEFERRYAE
jgi:2-methylisocitrate lyase-like PEP mutase family enzyme